MPEVLEDAGVSWKYYNPGGSLYSIETMRKIGLTTDSVLPYFSQYENPVLGAVQEGVPADLPR